MALTCEVSCILGNIEQIAHNFYVNEVFVGVGEGEEKASG